MANTNIYPYNLMKEIVDNDVAIYAENPDCVAGLDYALSTLDDRQRKILENKYKQNMTLAEIGETFEITRERVNQLCQKAIRKLKLPQCYRYIVFGVNGVKEAESTKGIQEQAVYEEEKSHFAQLSYEKLKDFLDVRAYNCLNRYAMVGRKEDTLTIGRICCMTDTELLRIRNLGVASMKNIREGIQKLKEYYQIDGNEAIVVNTSEEVSYDMEELVKLCIHRMVVNGDCEFANAIKKKYDALKAR